MRAQPQLQKAARPYRPFEFFLFILHAADICQKCHESRSGRELRPNRFQKRLILTFQTIVFLLLWGDVATNSFVITCRVRFQSFPKITCYDVQDATLNTKTLSRHSTFSKCRKSETFRIEKLFKFCSSPNSVEQFEVSSFRKHSWQPFKTLHEKHLQRRRSGIKKAFQKQRSPVPAERLDWSSKCFFPWNSDIIFVESSHNNAPS